jgi:hypothetical protein
MKIDGESHFFDTTLNILYTAGKNSAFIEN